MLAKLRLAETHGVTRIESHTPGVSLRSMGPTWVSMAVKAPRRGRRCWVPSAPHLTRAGDADTSGQSCWPRARPSPARREQRPALPSASSGRWRRQEPQISWRRCFGLPACRSRAKARYEAGPGGGARHRPACAGAGGLAGVPAAAGAWKRGARWQARPGGERAPPQRPWPLPARASGRVPRPRRQRRRLRLGGRARCFPPARNTRGPPGRVLR